MSQYSEMVEFMRKQGAAYNPEGISLAVMTGDKSCKMGDFHLEAEDLYISEHLLHPAAIKVEVTEAHTDKSAYLNPLHAGDLVLIQKIGNNQYAIMEKVVKA